MPAGGQEGWHQGGQDHLQTEPAVDSNITALRVPPTANGGPHRFPEERRPGGEHSLFSAAILPCEQYALQVIQMTNVEPSLDGSKTQQ